VQQERFMIQTEQLIDSYHEAYFAMKCADRWLSMHLEMLGNILVFANALLIVMLPVCTITAVSETKALITCFPWFPEQGMVSPGAAGFSLSAAMSTTGLLNWMVRSAADTEAMMNSVERILQFADDIPQEKQVISGADPVEDVSRPSPTAIVPRRADANWPSEGKVVFDNFQLRYRPGLDLALKGITCTIESNEKVNIALDIWLSFVCAASSTDHIESTWVGDLAGWRRGQNWLGQELHPAGVVAPRRGSWRPHHHRRH
jgi:ABC-type multidrug transport system fused ATPase/permease subunit